MQGWLRMFVRRLFTSTYNVDNLLSGLISGERSALARSITLVESALPEHRKQAQELLSRLPAPKCTFRIGITGSPGVGKSTLIEKLGLHCISLGHRVATLAVDPSSHKSGGSILGDKTRMTQLSNNPHAFIRPSPSRGHLGGVARYTFESVKLCEAAGFDVIFIETVGVGQSELMVSDLTDIFVLVVAPGAGDELQGMKKGITEAADLVLVNKSDTADAKKTLHEYRSALLYSSDSNIKQIVPVSAHTGEGISPAWEAIEEFQKQIVKSKQFERNREKQKTKWIWQFAKGELVQRFEENQTVNLMIQGKDVNISEILEHFYRDELKHKK